VDTNFRARAFPSQSVRLVPGPYFALISPVDQRPGLETSFMVRPPTGDVVKKEFQITPYRHLTGIVAWSTDSRYTFSGVRVSAISTTTGLASTASVTGTSGEYAIDLPDTEDDAFTLSAIPAPGPEPSWSYREDIIVSDMTRSKTILLEPTSGDARGKA